MGIYAYHRLVLTNSGTIASTAPNGLAVSGGDDTTITNTLLLSGDRAGAGKSGLAPGTIHVTNALTGTITGARYGVGPRAGSMTATVSNAGTISGGYGGVNAHDGSVTNAAGAIIEGRLPGSYGVGFVADGTLVNAGRVSAYQTAAYAYDALTLTNTGTIVSLATNGVWAGDASVITNSGTITGYAAGYIPAIRLRGSATVGNSGTISGGNGILAQTDLTLTNTGTITGTHYGAGAFNSILVSNGVGAPAASIHGDAYGLYAQQVTITNAGTISGGTRGILGNQVTLTNAKTGVVTGTTHGIRFDTGTVTNRGRITSTGPVDANGAGVFLAPAGAVHTATITNGDATLAGAKAAITATSGAGIRIAGVGTHTIENWGTISGYSGQSIAIDSGGSTTVIEHTSGHLMNGTITGGGGAADTMRLANDGILGKLDLARLDAIGQLGLDAGATWRIPGRLALTAVPTLALEAASSLQVTGTLATDASLTLASAGTLGVTGAVRVGVGASALAPGRIVVEPGNTLTATGQITATNLIAKGGLAIPDNGSLALTGALTGAGTITLGSFSLFSLANHTGAQVIDFGGLSATLELRAPASTIGTIADFGSGDLIDLDGIGAATSMSLFGTTLKIDLPAGGKLALRFATAPTLADLTLSDDGHGGTLLGHN